MLVRALRFRVGVVVVIVVAGRVGVPRARNSSSRVLLLRWLLADVCMASMLFFIVFCFQLSYFQYFLLLLWYVQFVAAAAISPVVFVFTL